MRELIASLKTARVKYVDSGLWTKKFFDRMVDMDPSPTKKYLEWMCDTFQAAWSYDTRVFTAISRGFDMLGEQPERYLLRMGDVINRLHSLLSRHLFPGFDINKTQPYLDGLAKQLEEVSRRAGEHAWGLDRLKLGVDYNRTAENKDWIVFEILNYKASRVIGSGTPWCVVAAENHYRDYTKNGAKVFFFVVNRKDFHDKYAVLVPRTHANVVDLYPFKLSEKTTSSYPIVTNNANQEVSLDSVLTKETGFTPYIFVPSSREEMTPAGVMELVRKEIGAHLPIELIRLDDKKVRLTWGGLARFKTEFWLKFFDKDTLKSLFTSESPLELSGSVELLDIEFEGIVENMKSFSGCDMKDAEVNFEGCTIKSLEGLPPVSGISLLRCSVERPFHVKAPTGVPGQLFVNRTDLKGSVFDGFWKVLTDSDSTGTYLVKGASGESCFVHVDASYGNPNVEVKPVMDVPYTLKLNPYYTRSTCRVRLDLPDNRLVMIEVRPTDNLKSVIFDRPFNLEYVEIFQIFPGAIPTPMSDSRIYVLTRDGKFGPLPGLEMARLNALVVSSAFPIEKATKEITMGLSPGDLKEFRLPTMPSAGRFMWTLDFVPDRLKFLSYELKVSHNPEFNGKMWLYGSSCPSWSEVHSVEAHSWLWSLFRKLVEVGHDPNCFYLRGVQCPKRFFESI